MTNSTKNNKTSKEKTDHDQSVSTATTYLQNGHTSVSRNATKKDSVQEVKTPDVKVSNIIGIYCLRLVAKTITLRRFLE